MAEFAPQYPRTNEGWVIFPDDQDQRREVFVHEVMEHPAKANLWMLQSIIEYVSEPGDSVMDIMAGTGSILIGAGMDRRVICVELEEQYYKLILASLDNIAQYLDYAKDIVTIIHGDCRHILPLPANHIIFSPPYAKQRIGKTPKEHQESTRQLAGTYQDSIDEYQADPRNLGNLNKFLFNQEMEKVYNLCYQSIIPGGTLTVIIKDYIEKQKRVNLSNWVIRSCLKAGFENTDWFKREALGTGFLKLWRSRGMRTVDDEDIIIFGKPPELTSGVVDQAIEVIKEHNKEPAHV